MRRLLVAWVVLSSTLNLNNHAAVPPGYASVDLEDYILVYRSGNEGPEIVGSKRFCEQYIGTGPASYHSDEQWNQVRDYLFQFLSGNLMFAAWAQNEPLTYRDSTIKFNRWRNRDGTDFDYLRPAGVFVNNLGKTGSAECITMYHNYVRTGYKGSCGRPNQYACNRRSNEEWRAINSPAGPMATVECDSNRHCVLNCTDSRICINTRHSLTDAESFTLLCVVKKYFYTCEAFEIDLERVNEVMVPRLEQGKQLLWNSLRMTVKYADTVRWEAQAYQSILDIQRAKSVFVTDHSEDWVISQFVHVYLSEVDSVTLRPMDYSLIQAHSVGLLNLTSSVPMTITRMRLSDVNRTLISCDSRDLDNPACRFSESVRIESQLRQMQLRCVGESSCAVSSSDDGSLLRMIGNRSSISEILELNCEDYGSCPFSLDIPFQSIPDGLFLCGSDSCAETTLSGKRLTDNNHVSLLRNLSIVSTAMSVECLNTRSCVGLSLSHGNDLTVRCDGQNACKNAEFQSNGGRLSVSCENSRRDKNTRSCDHASLFGWCADQLVSLAVGNNEKSEAVSVICPRRCVNGADPCCVISVHKKGSLKSLEVGLTSEDWRDDSVLILGKDNIERANSLHLKREDEGECSLKRGSFGCYLQKDRQSDRWYEASVCTDYSLSLYSPTSICILGLSTLLSLIFLTAALNIYDHRMERDERNEKYLRCVNVLSGMCLCVFLASLLLMDYESRSSDEFTSGDTDDSTKLGIVFLALAGLSQVFFCAFIMSLQILSHSDGSSWLLNKLSLREDDRSVLICLIVLRIFQMLLIYVVISSIDSRNDDPSVVLSLFFAALILDCAILAPSKTILSLLICLLFWSLTSVHSPIALAKLWDLLEQPSYFQVFASFQGKQSLLAWFDLSVMQLLFGVSSVLLALPNHRSRLRLWSLFVQFLDWSTDLTVTIFWLSSSLFFWAGMQFWFVFIAGLMVLLPIRHLFPSKGHQFLILAGMGRGLIKIQTWNGTDQWLTVDRTAGQTETFYESYPSLTFATYLLISSHWNAHLSDGSIIVDTAQFGPMFISMLITVLGIALKAYDSSSVIRGRRSKIAVRILVFIFLMSDLIMRVVPLCICFALAQSDSINEFASPALCATVLTVIPMLSLLNCLLIQYCVAPEKQQKETSLSLRQLCLFYAFPCTLSCNPLLFGCFDRSGVPNVFDFSRVMRSQFAAMGVSVLISVISVAVHPDLIPVFPQTMLAYLLSLLVQCSLVYCSRYLSDHGSKNNASQQ